MKSFQVTSAQIVVSANSLVPAGWLSSFEVTGILPGCRKNVKISTMPAFMAIVCRPLFGYNGSASIHPEDWRKLIEEAPVVSSRVMPFVVTPEIEAAARAEVLSVCDCPAVRDNKDVDPDYARRQTWDKYVRRASALPITE